MTYLEQVDKAPTVLKSLDGDIWLGECNVHQVVRNADNEIAELKELLRKAKIVLKTEGYSNLVQMINEALDD